MIQTWVYILIPRAIPSSCGNEEDEDGAEEGGDVVYADAFLGQRRSSNSCDRLTCWAPLIFPTSTLVSLAIKLATSLMFPGEITHVVVERLDGDPEVSWHEIERDV